MAHDPSPQWQPLSRLPFIAAVLDGMLTDTEEHYQTLLEAKPKPYVLDDATVARVLQVYSDQAADFRLYQEQLARWGRDSLTATQRREVTRLAEQLDRLRVINAAILALAEELQTGTIERLLAKSDLEIGLEWLLRQSAERTQD
jgi:hypothetical protein